MKKNKINLRGISEILNEKELKNIMGGCGACGSGTARCYHSYTCDDGSGNGNDVCYRFSMCLDPEGAYLFCSYWWAAGHYCMCSSNY